jgi:hypothetical protein
MVEKMKDSVRDGELPERPFDQPENRHAARHANGDGHGGLTHPQRLRYEVPDRSAQHRTGTKRRQL